MRLHSAAVAAVLIGGSLAGITTASATASAVVRAVRHSVTVTTIDRAGEKVSAPVELLNLKTGTTYNLTSGKASRVPDGRYNVGAQIETPANPPSSTLADREITVSRSATVTLDARRGRLVRFAVNDRRATTSQVFVMAGSPVTGFEYGGEGGAATYVIPGKLPSRWNFYVMADLSSATASGAPVQYGLIRVIKGAVPAAPRWDSSISKLATLRASVRRLSPGDIASIQLTPDISGPSRLPFPIWSASLAYGGQAPYTAQFRLTPGYAWRQSRPYGEAAVNNVPVWRARQYSETFGAATFSPDWEAEQDVSVEGNRLFAGTPDGTELLVDPAFTAFTGDSPGLPASYTAALYQGRKLIARGGGAGIRARIPAATKWYREDVVARPDSGQMFGQVTLDYTFQAAAQPDYGSYYPDYVVPTIKPSGLNADNAARAGTRTAVPIRLTYAAADHSVVVHGVQAWASGNGGKAWIRLKVRHIHGKWTVTVTNPSKTGYVSLRVRAALSNGVTTQVTVVNAYAVS
jgi:hypothetical protein